MHLKNVLKLLVLTLTLTIWSVSTLDAQCLGGLQVSTRSGETALKRCPQQIGTPDIIRFTTGSAPTPVAYLLTDENNVVLRVSTSSNMDLTGIGAGIFRVWAFSYAGSILVEEGDNAAEVSLGSLCGILTDNYVTIQNFGEGDCFSVQVLHNNDGESQLINAGGDLANIGGVARFKRELDGLRSVAFLNDWYSILLSSGDNFLPGPEFNANLELDESDPLYDAVALQRFGYDAICIGNHDFDFGPDILERFIRDFGDENAPPFLSANLDFSGEPGLQALVDEERIKASTIVFRGDEPIGVIGLTTPQLPFISSPRNVEVDDALTTIVQAQVDAFEAEGINKIILISHLQSIDEELDLAGTLTGVDIIIAGGGDELLTNDPSLSLEGQEVYGEYPLTATNAAGDEVLVVTTPGEYRYVGQLVVTFFPDGEIALIDEVSDLVLIDNEEENAEILELVTEPVSEFVEGLAQNVIATTEVDLDGVRGNVRTVETNEGNLIADALLWQGNQLATDFGITAPMVALQNGGGIRNNNIIDAGSDITELTTFDILPFSNFVSVIEPLPASQFKEILENAVSQVENTSGRFAQVAGFSFVWDENGTPQELDDDGNVATAGTRVVTVALDDGTKIVEDGALVDGAPDIVVATIDFLARGGDQYPYRGAGFTSLGVSYQQALANYIIDGLGGLITAADYPEGGEGRITRLGAVPFQANLAGMDVAESNVFQTNAYPNPVDGELNLSYRLETDSRVNIRLTNALGQQVAAIFAGEQEAGHYARTINLSGFAQGTYFLTIQTADQIETLTLIKE